MTIGRFSVTRPVATVVFMLLLIVFGLIALNRMPVREYPDIDVPVISIRTTYTGASSSVVESRITQTIEDAVSGIEGLTAIESTSRDGQSRINLEFAIERDIDAAANDVRDRVSRVQRRLPDDADAPVVAKSDSSSSPVVILALSSLAMSRMELTDYADRYLLDRFSVIDGVSSAEIFGAQEKAMRIWLDRREMAARQVTVEDVENALKRENIEYPAGRIESLEREFVVRLNRQFGTPTEFGDLVIRQDGSGSLVRLRHVAKVEVAARSPRSIFIANGRPTIGIAVYKQSKANTLSVSNQARLLMATINRELPEGMRMEVLRDEARFIKASIEEVKGSLVVAAILVVLIIFLFLGSVRAALIPALTVPISLVAAFMILYYLDYSINLLTLLALVLAIGMVVDDAIVVLENVHRRIEEGEPPLVAAVRGADQVLFAVIATTLVLAAVFLPICLWSGKTGKLFTEFAVAMTAAIGFSSLVAMTLTPMLCSKMLKPRGSDAWLARLIDWTMEVSARAYLGLLRLVARFKVLTLGSFAGLCILMAWGWGQLASEYEPEEDRAAIMVRLIAPEGTGFYAMNSYVEEVNDKLYELLRSTEANNVLTVMPGFGGGSDSPVNTGNAMVELADWGERPRSARQILTSLRASLREVPGIQLQPSLPSGISSRGNPVQFVIGGPEYTELVEWRDRVIEKARSYPGLVDADYDYKETTPQLAIDIDRKRADELGVSAESIGASLQTMLGSRQITTYIDRGKEYDVMVQADRDSRMSPTELSNIFVRSQTSGELIPLDNLVRVTERGEAGQLNRYNRVRAITISGNVAPGYTLGDVLDFLERTVREELPEYAQISYKGTSKDFREAAGSMVFIFGLALLVSYLALAAQFESFISPAIVMLTVPLGMIGAIAALYWMGISINIYTQIGLIMLIGLAAKNGILIVEFANQLRDEGIAFEEAVFQASKLRLRPILMTGISTVAGAVPLLLATGAGAASRQGLGAVVVYGGFSACILTLFVVPVGYLVFARGQKSPHALAHELERLETAEAKE